MHLYLAGPYSPFTDDDGIEHTTEQNVRRATEVAAEAFDKGHVPITPHLLSHNPAKHTEADALDHDFWYDVTLDMARRCDGMVLLPFWEHSAGAKQELEYAKDVGMPQWLYELDGMPDLHITEQRSPIQCTAFIEQLMTMYRVHLKKNADYSPLNVHMTGDVGIVTRLWDKMARLLSLTGFRAELKDVGTYEKPTDPANEAIEDTYIDLANYGVIGKLLRDGKWGH